MPRIDRVVVSAFTIPTDAPESDGTHEWRDTTIVVVEVGAGGARGLGYTYADFATATLVRDHLVPVVRGRDPMQVSAAWDAMVRSIRNLGRPGVASMAIAAVDTALWDLKARLLDLPLVTLLGAMRDRIAVYGSGGFTSYTIERLQDQMAGYVRDGLCRVKMKIGREPAADPDRVSAAREAIGADTELFVDANGAFTGREALRRAATFERSDVTWFEEPVSSDDLAGLRFVRGHGPTGMAVAAGEYGYDLPYFHRMLEAGAVDVLQADASRCAGITGFLQVDALCDAFGMPLSAHTAPSLHVHPCCAAKRLVHVEYFHDHARIERLLFDGAAIPVDGAIAPDLSRPGLGLDFKQKEAARFAA